MKLRIIFYTKILIFTLGSVNTRLSLYLCILTYVALGNQLTAEKAFVVIGCYNALRSVITISIPIGIAQIAEAKSAVKRIKEVLVAEEVHREKRQYNVEKPCIRIIDATVKIEANTLLEDINLSIDKGLIAIAGPIGNVYYYLLN